VVLLPHAPASVVAARSQISTDLREAGVVTPAIGDAALVVSELLTNAILHARPLPGAQVLVAWALRERSLEVAVSDGGSMTRPRTAQPSLSSIGGRGLAIVENLACRWGVLPSDFGLTVWAVLPAPGDGRADGGQAAGYGGHADSYGGQAGGNYGGNYGGYGGNYDGHPAATAREQA
jgi:anti-sigma regulatory factor (Ser/Thr protein kinase)